MMTKKEVAKTIRALMRACDELMTEFIGKKRAADWEVINDAMVAGGKVLNDLETATAKVKSSDSRTKR